MMKKDKYVVFGNNGARIYKGIHPGGEAIKNPSFNMVKGIPPHHWKLLNGMIHPMTDQEKSFLKVMATETQIVELSNPVSSLEKEALIDGLKLEIKHQESSHKLILCLAACIVIILFCIINGGFK